MRGFILGFREEFFYTVGKLTPGEKDAVSAGEALNPDIRAEPDDFPLVPAARVRLAQAQPVFDLQVR
jgi:hypothetical protein